MPLQWRNNWRAPTSASRAPNRLNIGVAWSIGIGMGAMEVNCDCSACQPSSRTTLPGRAKCLMGEMNPSAVSQRLAADQYAFFAPRLVPPELVPPEEAEPETFARDSRRVEQRPDFRYSRWHSTTTTFGPTIKVLVTLVLIVYPLLATVRHVFFGSYEVGPASAGDLLFNSISWALCGAITWSMWRPGRL